MVAKEVSHALALHRCVSALPRGPTTLDTRENPFTKVTHYRIKSMARKRKLVSLLLLFYRLFSAALLVYVGTFFLVYTVSVTELILNDPWQAYKICRAHGKAIQLQWPPEAKFSDAFRPSPLVSSWTLTTCSSTRWPPRLGGIWSTSSTHCTCHRCRDEAKRRKAQYHNILHLCMHLHICLYVYIYMYMYI